MKVIIAGSRNITDIEDVEKAIERSSSLSGSRN